MTRPSIIRADTIDLQDHNGPSAQDQSHPRLDLDGNHFAPHQAETLRDVAHETARDLLRSPTLAGIADPNQALKPAANSSHPADNLAAPDDKNPDTRASDLTDAMDAYRQHEQDAIAAAHNGPSSSDEEDLDDAIDDLDDDLMDKISSSPSIEDVGVPESPTDPSTATPLHTTDHATGHNIEPTAELPPPGNQEDDATADDNHPVTPFDHDYNDFSSDESLHDSEDIDFEFVYALHTFVATVEGQANATKGDTMVLLDDSNSYWWLVRVVKDSSIGYLPAEHIETPTERLARLNKHRNIDLSATMLGDQTIKPKTSFKGIRRKRKTVAFTEPTYVDYSDFDYSSDEEDIEELFGTQPQSAREQAAQAVQQSESQNATDEARVEPLRTTKDAKSDATKDAKAANGTEKATAKEASLTKVDSLDSHGDDETSSVEEIINESSGVSRSKNGTVRNTDSFFNDEETKKITLTPNLLRDDNAASRPSTDSLGKDSSKGRSSIERMERELVSDKDRKKSKDKKPSAIRSFFSRKDKKKSEDDDESFGKRSMDIMDAEDREETGSPDKSGHKAKLQKPQPRIEPSASRKAATAQAQQSTVELSSYLNETRINNVSSVPPASMRIVDAETQEPRSVPSSQPQQSESPPSRKTSSASRTDKPSALSKTMPHRSPSNGSEPKPQKTVKAKTRMEIDGSDISDIEEEQKHPTSTSPTQTRDATAAQTNGAPSPASSPAASRDRTVTPQTAVNHASEPSHMSPGNASNPPALVPDTSSPEDRSPENSPSPSPELMAKGGSAASSRKDVWDDVKLRAFFDDNEHIRDLLAVVYDKSDVEPVSADHPAMGGMFREQNAKLAEITTQLDNLLGDWLARKQRLRGSA